MLFKQRKINRLKIKIAEFKAAATLTECFMSGDVSGFMIDRHERNVKILAKATAELSILESK